MKQGDLLQIVKESMSLDEAYNPENEEINSIIRMADSDSRTLSSEDIASLEDAGLEVGYNDFYGYIISGPNGTELFSYDIYDLVHKSNGDFDFYNYLTSEKSKALSPEDELNSLQPYRDEKKQIKNANNRIKQAQKRKEKALASARAKRGSKNESFRTRRRKMNESAGDEKATAYDVWWCGPEDKEFEDGKKEVEEYGLTVKGAEFTGQDYDVAIYGTLDNILNYFQDGYDEGVDIGYDGLVELDNGKTLYMNVDDTTNKVILTPEPQSYKLKEEYSLVGQDGNAFSLMGYTARCMKECGLRDEIDEMRERAMSSDYNNLIVVCDEYIQKCNEIAGDDVYECLSSDNAKKKNKKVQESLDDYDEFYIPVDTSSATPFRDMLFTAMEEGDAETVGRELVSFISEDDAEYVCKILGFVE